MTTRALIFTVAVAIWLTVTLPVSADDNLREVQTKLRDEGFYAGEVDGAYSSDLSAALSRYQIRNGLPITGQLDVDTSEALGTKPAVTNTAAAPEQSSETWRRLRRGERQTSTKARETSSARADETTGTSTEKPPRSAPAAKARSSAERTEPVSSPPATASESVESTLAPPATGRSSSESTESASSPPATASDIGSQAPEFSTERLRDYVAAFVLAGLDKNVGAETEFFADRVEYYDSGIVNRESIREDLKRYDERWPERHFWVAGAIIVEPQTENRVRVTFPLGFKLRNGNKQSSGKVDKTLVLERAGDDLQIAAVNEVSESKK